MDLSSNFYVFFFLIGLFYKYNNDFLFKIKNKEDNGIINWFDK